MLIPMKRLTDLYQSHPVVALVVNGLLFFAWAVTLIFIITIMAVAFSG